MSVTRKNIQAELVDDRKFQLVEKDFTVNGTPLIKVTHVGICGTDMSWWKEGSKHKGQVIGHEYAGIIEDPGQSSFQVGDRVTGYTQNNENEFCGICDHCLAGDFENCDNRVVKTWIGGDLSHPGAYGQYTTWFGSSLYKLPDNVSNEEGAVIEPLTVSLHAVNITNIQKDDKVLVLGGGIIGLGVAEWARSAGAGTVAITEVVPEKIEAIKELQCADYVLKGDADDLFEQYREVSKGGFDVVFDCAGVAPAINGAITHAFKPHVRDVKKFTCVALAHQEMVPINYNEVVLREVQMRGSKGHLPQEFEMALRMVAEGKVNVKKFITKKVPFMEVQAGLEEIVSGGGTIGKAVIEM